MKIVKLLKYLQDKNIKTTRKLLFLLPIIYFISPINLIPYLLFPIAGWLDNFIVSILLVIYLNRVLENYQPDTGGPKTNYKKDDVINMDRNDYDID